MSIELEFKSDACCGGYLHAEVQHASGAKTVVEDLGGGRYNVLSLRNGIPVGPLVEGVDMEQVQHLLARDAA